MIYTAQTRLALKIMAEAHKGQLDRSGLPYILHPFHVAEQMRDEATTAAALLHDVLEDTDMTEDQLLEAGIRPDVVRAVVLLTHKEGVDYFDYVRALSEDPVAREVKLADLDHNSDLGRLDAVSERDLERLKKYEKAKDILLNRK